METCKSIPYSEQMYCYGQVDLSEYDKLFLILLAAALCAIVVTYIQGRAK